MNKKIGLFWLRDDFRISKNNGLIEATINHDQVVVFYLYKRLNYKSQEAQKWWLSKSLICFRKNLEKFNINLEIIETESFKIFFEKLFKKRTNNVSWIETLFLTWSCSSVVEQYPEKVCVVSAILTTTTKTFSNHLYCLS